MLKDDNGSRPRPQHPQRCEEVDNAIAAIRGDKCFERPIKKPIHCPLAYRHSLMLCPLLAQKFPQNTRGVTAY
jgi:hypothetical protein